MPPVRDINHNPIVEIEYSEGQASTHAKAEAAVVPESEQCGWLKDKYGVSWQVSPTVLNKMLSEGTPEQVARVTQAFLKMKKFNLAQLEAAYRGPDLA